MKLVIAIVNPGDAQKCVNSLNSLGIPCTWYGSNGGFLSTQNATLLTAVDELRVEMVFDVLRKHAKQHVEKLEAAGAVAGGSYAHFPAPVDVEVGGATVMVMELERFEKL